MLHQARRRRGLSYPVSTPPRRPLVVEHLEDRNLLSTSPLANLGSFRLDPAGSYDASRILVQFQLEQAIPDAQSILPGSTYGPALRLVPGYREVNLPSGVGVTTALAAFQANSFVVFAEPDYYGQISAIPDDPLWDRPGLYGLRIVQGQEAWDYHVGNTSVITAVLDTGANYNHEDLCQNVWLNQGEIPPDRLVYLTDVDFDGLITFWDLNDPINQGPDMISDIDGDGRVCGSDVLAPMDAEYGGWADGIDGEWDGAGNGYVDDLVGWNFCDTTATSCNVQSNTPLDPQGHGTHLAGTIGAVGNNGVGITGINWVTQVMPLKVTIGATGTVNTARAIAALNYAVMMGAAVSNASWGGPGTFFGLDTAIRNSGAYGHVFVAAAGNNNQNIDVVGQRFYPAYWATTIDNIISVAASTNIDAKASFSNYGPNSVHLFAPGANIYSLGRQGDYRTLSGTSQATPLVTGAYAFLKSAFPHLDYLTIKDAMLVTVDVNSSLEGFVITGGRLNLLNAFLYLAEFFPDPGPGGGNPSGGRSGKVLPGGPSSAEATPVLLSAPADAGNAALLVEALLPPAHQLIGFGADSVPATLGTGIERGELSQGGADVISAVSQETDEVTPLATRIEATTEPGEYALLITFGDGSGL